MGNSANKTRRVRGTCRGSDLTSRMVSVLACCRSAPALCSLFCVNDLPIRLRLGSLRDVRRAGRGRKATTWKCHSRTPPRHLPPATCHPPPGVQRRHGRAAARTLRYPHHTAHCKTAISLPIAAVGAVLRLTRHGGGGWGAVVALRKDSLDWLGW